MDVRCELNALHEQTEYSNDGAVFESSKCQKSFLQIGGLR